MRKKIIKKIFITLLIILIVIILFNVIYMLIPRTASAQAKLQITDPNNIITQYNDNEIICSPKDSTPDAGIIFYTGAKIEPYSYGYLFEDLAKNNILCISIDSPLHFPLFNDGNCDNIFTRFPNINNWYFAGHSLGGEFADRQALKYQDKVTGAINLGAHIRQNFSESNLRVLNVYASNDAIANPNDYYIYENNLPLNKTCYIIEGGCHAYFADFGTMLFDGNPSISPEEQAEESATIINNFINKI